MKFSVHQSSGARWAAADRKTIHDNAPEPREGRGCGWPWPTRESAYIEAVGGSGCFEVSFIQDGEIIMKFAFLLAVRLALFALGLQAFLLVWA